MELRAAMTVELSSQALCIKDRTIRTNYATGYAVGLYLCLILLHRHVFTLDTEEALRDIQWCVARLGIHLGRLHGVVGVQAYPSHADHSR